MTLTRTDLGGLVEAPTRTYTRTLACLEAAEMLPSFESQGESKLFESKTLLVLGEGPLDWIGRQAARVKGAAAGWKAAKGAGGGLISKIKGAGYGQAGAAQAHADKVAHANEVAKRGAAMLKSRATRAGAGSVVASAKAARDKKMAARSARRDPYIHSAKGPSNPTGLAAGRYDPELKTRETAAKKAAADGAKQAAATKTAADTNAAAKNFRASARAGGRTSPDTPAPSAPAPAAPAPTPKSTTPAPSGPAFRSAMRADRPATASRSAGASPTVARVAPSATPAKTAQRGGPVPSSQEPVGALPGAQGVAKPGAAAPRGGVVQKRIEPSPSGAKPGAPQGQVRPKNPSADPATSNPVAGALGPASAPRPLDKGKGGQTIPPGARGAHAAGVSAAAAKKMITGSPANPPVIVTRKKSADAAREAGRKAFAAWDSVDYSFLPALSEARFKPRSHEDLPSHEGFGKPPQMREKHFYGGVNDKYEGPENRKTRAFAKMLARRAGRHEGKSALNGGY